MVLVFGGFVAAGMPIIGAIASIAGALASLLGFSHLIDLDATVVNVVTVLGLGLCIDYGLLTVSRFREELRSRVQGRPAAEITREEILASVARTVDSAGRTVVFSGLTVAISLGGLLVFEASILKAIGVGRPVRRRSSRCSWPSPWCPRCASSARAGCSSAAPSRPPRRASSPAWPPVCSGTRCWSIIAVLAVLGTLAAPALDLRLTSSGRELLPVSAPQRQFFDGAGAQTTRSSSGPDVQVVAEASLAGDPGVCRVAAGRRRAAPHGAGRERHRHASPSWRSTPPAARWTTAPRDAVTALRDDRPDFPT